MVTVNDKEYIALKLELWQIQGDEVLTELTTQLYKFKVS